ncbi:Prefoldin subunit-domain-containing protein [Nemania sp. NC0429]|nr:Prefoldin subunit-domain-containing protein [Nemania sp. NC0429]
MSQARDALRDPEEHLRQLEERVDKLVIALDEWQQWKQDYEALRKEVDALSPTATRSALAQTRQAFAGELVDEKELVEIFGRNDSKKRDQVISTVSNRLDYVSKNIATLAKQLETAENTLATSRASSHPDADGEDGLPITEISEELDDDDNVVSYSLRRPGDSQTQLVEALEKAGITESSSGSHDAASSTASDISKPSPDVSSKPTDTPPQPQPNGANVKSTDASSRQVPKKKSVAFTEDTKEASENRPGSHVQKLEELYRQAKEQENVLIDPVMPADESQEDAELREDMIRYNRETMMYEMAPIVAELQLEEGSDDDDWNYDGSEDDDNDDDDDDEDQWGRSTSGVVDDKYRRQMLELRERLSKKTFGEKEASSDEDDEFAEGIGRITVKHENRDPPKDNPELPAANRVVDSISKDEAKKSVRFAPSLDVAEPSPSATQPESLQPQPPDVDPLSDVVERRPSEVNDNIPKSGRKPSRFRKARANDAPAMQPPAIAPEKPTDTTRYAPSGPEGQTIASNILENEPSDKIKEPDELDANLLHQQVTEEYYKMRNKMIGRHGGFLKENTDPIQPLDEEEGGPKRLSRFKAARLAKS